METKYIILGLLILIAIIVLIIVLVRKDTFEYEKLRMLLWGDTENGDFLENCSSWVTEKPDQNSVSLALSGGGSRALTCSLGCARALFKMGLMNKFKGWVSTVSGGGWFWGAYSFANFAPSQLLGRSAGENAQGLVDPTLITLKELNDANYRVKEYIGNVVTENDIAYYILEGLVNYKVPMDQVWNYGVGRLIFEPLKIPGDRPVAASRLHSVSLMKRNKLPNPPIVARNTLPYWICNATLMMRYPDPNKQGEIQLYPYANLPLTPLYSGIKHKLPIGANTIGGHLVETIGFGNTEPPVNGASSVFSCTGEFTTLKTVSPTVRTLNDMVGVSSSAEAGILFDPTKVTPLGKYLPKSFQAIVTNYTLWGTQNLIPTAMDSQCTLSATAGCNVPIGFDPSSCTRYLNKCYSKTAPQCSSNNQCGYSARSGECKNTAGGSDLYCRLGLSGCKCSSPEPQLTAGEERVQLFSQPAKLGDGAYADNTGVISLVARGAKKIISIVSTDAHIVNTFLICDIAALFGMATEQCISTQYVYGLNAGQIFEQADWTNNILPQLLKNFNSGGPTWARASLKVLPNPLHGVAGNYTVDILFYALQPSSMFNSLLPEEVRKEITASGNPFTSGKLNYFPQYPTVLTGGFTGGMISMSQAQSNALSSYTDWCMMQIQPEIQSMFA